MKIRFIFIGLLIFELNSISVFSQDIDSLINSINSNYKRLNCLSYNIESTFRSILDSSDKLYNSKVYCKKVSLNDSIRDFFIVKERKLAYLFKDHYLSTFDTNNFTISVELISSPYKKIKRGIIHWSIFSPFILNINVLEPNKWDSMSSNKCVNYNSDCIDLLFNKSFENKDALIPNSPIIGSQKYKARINNSSSLITKVEDTIYIAPNPQITIFNFFNIDTNITTEEYDALLENYLKSVAHFARDTILHQVSSKKFIIEEGKAFPDTIKIFNLYGEPRLLSNFKCDFLVMDFWFRGCAPCITASKILNKLHLKYWDKPNFKIIGINVKDTSFVLLQKYLEKYDLKYDQYYTMNSEFGNYILKGYGFPVIVLYDIKHKKVLYFTIGVDDKFELELTQAIDRILEVKTN